MACYLPRAKAPVAEEGASPAAAAAVTDASSLPLPEGPQTGPGPGPGPCPGLGSVPHHLPNGSSVSSEEVAVMETPAKVAVSLPLPKMPPRMVPMDVDEKLQLSEMQLRSEGTLHDPDDDLLLEPDYDFGPKTSQLLELAATEKTKASQKQDDRSHWGPLRHRAAAIVEATFPGGDTNIFDSITSVAIFFNILVMIYETDDSAKCLDAGKTEDDCGETWLVVSNWILLSFYTFEVVVRFTAWHLAFFRSRWNWLDFIVVFMGWAQPLVANSMKELEKINILRLTRILRIIRVAKILKRMPTLHQMIRGFMGAMEAMMWGLVLILVLLVIWAILAVELIHPINVTLEHDDPWCEKAFSSVFYSTLLFFQTLVAGDSWGACAVPIILVRPWLYVLFAVALVSVQLGFTNLVLAVIVDKAAEVRDGTKEDRANAQAKKEKESLSRWKDLLVEMDTDESGTINRSELMAGCQDEGVQTFLQQMNMTKRDLMGLFNLLDDGSNSIPYEQFIDAFQKAQSQDTRIYLMVMKFQMQKLEKIIAETLQDRFGELKQDLSTKHRYGDTSRTPRAGSPVNRNEIGCSPISAQSRQSPPKSPKSSHTMSPFHLPKAFFGAPDVGAAKEATSSNHLAPPKRTDHQPKVDLHPADFEASLPTAPSLSNEAAHCSAPPLSPWFPSSSSLLRPAAEHSSSSSSSSSSTRVRSSHFRDFRTPGCSTVSGNGVAGTGACVERSSSSSSRRGTIRPFGCSSCCCLCGSSRMRSCCCPNSRCENLGLDAACPCTSEAFLRAASSPSSPTCSVGHQSWDGDSEHLLQSSSLCGLSEHSARLEHRDAYALDRIDTAICARRQQDCSPPTASSAGRTSCPMTSFAAVEGGCTCHGLSTGSCSSLCPGGLERELKQERDCALLSGKQYLEEAQPGNPIISGVARFFDEQLDKLQHSLEARLDALAAETTACCSRLERHGALITSWRSELALSAREHAKSTNRACKCGCWATSFSPTKGDLYTRPSGPTCTGPTFGEMNSGLMHHGSGDVRDPPL